nr:putative ribonuclease H-like domain-containing protein [Tanacetum cinerariifolium]
MDLKEQGVIDSGCSRHMTGNMSYLIEYEELDRGYVAFEGNSKGEKIIRKCTIKTGNLDFENVYFVRELKFNLFSVLQMCDKKNSVLFNDTECNTGLIIFKIFGRRILIRNKARLVAQGYTQEEGIDYDEVFSPVARIEAIRLFLAYALFKDFLMYQMDVKSAFLNGKIEEEVYVCQPPRFENPNFPDRVYKVEKGLYGLHQAPKAWYETVSTYLLDNGLQKGEIDKTLFIKRHKDDILLVQVYVDDIIFGSTKKELCIAFERFIEVKTASTPMETQKNLLKDKDGEEVDVHTYRSLIGSLMYLTSSRPDIIFLVCACARYQVNLKKEILQFKLQEVWTLVDLPNGKRAIGRTQKGNSCIERSKLDRGYAGRASTIQVIRRNKARLVAQRYTQEEGIDYDEVFAPVTRIKEIRLFLAYASFKEFVVYQMDVKSAFLYENIKEEVYLCQPLGFEDPDFPDRVYKVEKALYGLHQASRAWYETLSTYLLDNGFQRGKINKTLFFKRHKGDILLVQVYVDDIIFGSTKKELCIAFERKMPLTKSNMSEAAINELIAQRVADALADYETNQNSRSGMEMETIFGMEATIQESTYSNERDDILAKILFEAIKLARSLMDQKVLTYATRQAENKRRMDNNSRNNHAQQPPYKRQNVARAYAARLGEKK